MLLSGMMPNKARKILMLGHKKRQFTLAVQVWALAGKGDAVFAEWYGGSVISKGLTSVRRWPFVFRRFKKA
ncbi:MAG: hypothetical protein NTV37_10165 [Proteobacteria bacterium]|jgi:hypothetical protein|nr:hypothetical protein [Pseudomonadota bacterium]